VAARASQAGGLALSRTLVLLGAWIAIASLISGCDDPGPSSVTANAPANLGSETRAATLSWDAPTANTNGSALTDLSGYRIYYGSSPEDLSETVQISHVGLQTYVIDNLAPGTWYFAVMAVASNGGESALSDVVAKTIT
jgi:Fibronectin type III domain